MGACAEAPGRSEHEAALRVPAINTDTLVLEIFKVPQILTLQLSPVL